MKPQELLNILMECKSKDEFIQTLEKYRDSRKDEFSPEYLPQNSYQRKVKH